MLVGKWCVICHARKNNYYLTCILVSFLHTCIFLFCIRLKAPTKTKTSHGSAKKAVKKSTADPVIEISDCDSPNPVANLLMDPQKKGGSDDAMEEESVFGEDDWAGLDPKDNKLHPVMSDRNARYYDWDEIAMALDPETGKKCHAVIFGYEIRGSEGVFVDIQYVVKADYLSGECYEKHSTYGVIKVSYDDVQVPMKWVQAPTGSHSQDCAGTEEFEFK